MLFVAIAGVAMMRSDKARLFLPDPPAAAVRRAEAAGKGIFKAHCASCHGAGGQGGGLVEAPNLTDRDWLYGEGAADEIEQTVAYGVRSRHPKAWNLAYMPAYAGAGDKVLGIAPLSPGDVKDVIAHLRTLQHRPADPAAAVRGRTIFATRGGCFDCHGSDAGGDPATGAPNLTDSTWLYGDGSDAAVARSIEQGRRGIMPSFVETLSPLQIRQVAYYVRALSTPKEAR